MRKFTIFYKDHLGRSNQASNYATDDVEARKKFTTLYPDCVIMDIN